MEQATLFEIDQLIYQSSGGTNAYAFVNPILTAGPVILVDPCVDILISRSVIGIILTPILSAGVGVLVSQDIEYSTPTVSVIKSFVVNSGVGTLIEIVGVPKKIGDTAQLIEFGVSQEKVTAPWAVASSSNYLLARIQASTGVKNVSLVPILDLRRLSKDMSVEFVREVSTYSVATGGFHQAPKVLGKAFVESRFSLSLNPGATAHYDFLRCSGLTRDVNTFAPGQEDTDLTIWGVFGGLVTKSHSTKLNFEMSLELGQPGVISYNGLGAADGLPTPQAFDAPGETLPELVPAFIRTSAVSINGQNARLKKFTFTPKNRLVALVDGREDFGNARVVIAGRAPEWSAVVVSNNANFLNNLDSGIIDDLTVVYGVSNSRFMFSVGNGKCQLTGLQSRKEDGLNIINLSGTVLGDGWGLTFKY